VAKSHSHCELTDFYQFDLAFQYSLWKRLLAAILSLIQIALYFSIIKSKQNPAFMSDVTFSFEMGYRVCRWGFLDPPVDFNKDAMIISLHTVIRSRTSAAILEDI
jgi:hypothetical protein